ncbi:MAG: hypothetical protein EXX96DRAFT_582066 [Benjaminiella poitrasii]|nr:MAG: hypothetical protein EXX96DRAFT_582066 [Benjaminiella poitrasii]
MFSTLSKFIVKNLTATIITIIPFAVAAHNYIASLTEDQDDTTPMKVPPPKPWRYCFIEEDTQDLSFDDAFIIDSDSLKDYNLYTGKSIIQEAKISWWVSRYL